jgi:two-component system, NarL family, sensor kinase
LTIIKIQKDPLKKAFVLILGLIAFFVAGAGVPDADSLAKLINPVINQGKFFDKLPRPLSGNNQKDSVIIKRYLDNAARCEGAKPDSALFFATHALSESIRINWLKSISVSLQYIGDYAMSKENYPVALKYFLLASDIEEKRNDAGRKAELYDEIASVYFYQEIYPKAHDYYSRALAVFVKENDSAKLAMIYSHLGNLEFSRQYCEKRSGNDIKTDLANSISFYQKSVDLCVKLGKESRAVKGRLNIAASYNQLGQPEKALPLIESAFAFFTKNDDKSMISSTYFTMGVTYGKLKRYDKSIHCYNEALRIGKEIGDTGGAEYIYEQMAQTYRESGNFEKALDSYITYITMRDSIFSAQKSQQIIELETKYETAKKEQQIESLTYQKKVRNIVLISFAALLAALVVITYTVTRNLKARKKLAEQTIIIQEQQIAELEKERQLIATKAVLHGEETERKRMAHDLHDGLGGLLSGVKINLWNMKENAVISSDNITAFNQALGLLDNSIKELRRIAHNLMPETLMHYGLRTALQDFITQLPADSCKISFHSYGNEFRYQNDIELAAYRITQELVNNALKYSDAAKIDIQLFLEESRLSVQVSDNGKGFDTAVLKENLEGKGLQSIRNRVAMLKGKFEISSNIGEGTEAIIEFSVI